MRLPHRASPTHQFARIFLTSLTNISNVKFVGLRRLPSAQSNQRLYRHLARPLPLRNLRRPSHWRCHQYYILLSHTPRNQHLHLLHHQTQGNVEPRVSLLRLLNQWHSLLLRRSNWPLRRHSLAIYLSLQQKQHKLQCLQIIPCNHRQRKVELTLLGHQLKSKD